MNIVFDIDGVLACFEKNVKMVADELFPGRIPEGYIPNDWDYSDIFSKQDWKDVWKKIYTIPDFWLRQPDIPEGVEALKNFRNEFPDQPIIFITSRMATGGVSAKYQTQLWLMSQGLLKLNETNKVIVVSKPEEKLQYVKDLKTDLMIDDYGPTVERHNAEGYKTYLLDQPWNKNYTYLPRVYTVTEFLGIVKEALLS